MYPANLRKIERDTVKECWPPPTEDNSTTSIDDTKFSSHDKKLSFEDQKHDGIARPEVEASFNVVADAKPWERTSQPHFARFVQRNNKLEVQCSPGLKSGIEAILNGCHKALSWFGGDCGEYLQAASAEDVLNRLRKVLRDVFGITDGAPSVFINSDVSRTSWNAPVNQSTLTYLSYGQQSHYIFPQPANDAFIVCEGDQPSDLVPAKSRSSKLSNTLFEPAYIRMYFLIDDNESLRRFYRAKCNELQVKALKTILKIIIRCIVDKKQSKYPYNGGRVAKGFGAGRAISPNGRHNARGQLTRPPWWPKHVLHREPDHLKKEELHDLFVFFMEALGSDEVKKEKGKVTVAKLEEEILKASESLTEQKREWREIVVSILAVRKRREELEDGVTTCVRMMQPEVSRQALFDTFPPPEEKLDAASSPDEAAEDPLKETEDEDETHGVAAAGDLGHKTVAESVLPTIEGAHDFHKMLTASSESGGVGPSHMAQYDREASHDSSKTEEISPCEPNSSFEHMLWGENSYGPQQHTLPAVGYTSAAFVGSTQLSGSSMPTDLGNDTPVVPISRIRIPFMVAPQLPNASTGNDLGVIPPVDQASLMSTMILSSTPSQSPQVKKRKRPLNEQPDPTGEMPALSSQETLVEPAALNAEEEEVGYFQPGYASVPSFVTHNVLTNHLPALHFWAPKWMAGYETYMNQSQLAGQSFFGMDTNTYNPWQPLSLNQTFPPYPGNYGMVAPGPSFDFGFDGQLIRPMTSHMMRPVRPQGSFESYPGQSTGNFDGLTRAGNVSPFDKSTFPSKRRCHD